MPASAGAALLLDNKGSASPCFRPFKDNKTTTKSDKFI
jgi:hypothetical protein